MTEELLKALQLIKEECEKHSFSLSQDCRECPLRDASNDCGVISYTPCNWKLEKREVYF